MSSGNQLRKVNNASGASPAVANANANANAAPVANAAATNASGAVTEEPGVFSRIKGFFGLGGRRRVSRKSRRKTRKSRKSRKSRRAGRR